MLKKAFDFAHFTTRQTHFSKWAKIPLFNFGLFQQVFENLKLNKLAKEERRLDLEDRIWKLEFGKTQFPTFEAATWRMNFKACTCERLVLIFGFGRGAQVVKTSPFFGSEFIRRKRRRWAYHFYLVRFRPWDPTNPRFWKKTEHCFNNAEQDCETTILLAAVRCYVTATLAA